MASKTKIVKRMSRSSIVSLVKKIEGHGHSGGSNETSRDDIKHMGEHGRHFIRCSCHRRGVHRVISKRDRHKCSCDDHRGHNAVTTDTFKHTLNKNLFSDKLSCTCTDNKYCLHFKDHTYPGSKHWAVIISEWFKMPAIQGYKLVSKFTLSRLTSFKRARFSPV